MINNKKPILICLLGLPLSGKSTILNLLKNHEIYKEKILFQNTGEFLRSIDDSNITNFLSNINGGESFSNILQVKNQIKISNLAQNHFMDNLDIVLNDNSLYGMIADGFPRFSWQANFITNENLNLINLFNIRVILLTNSLKTTLKNFEERRLVNPRADDKIFKNRYKTQKKVLEGVIQIFKSNFIGINTINTNVTPEESYQNIQMIINKLLKL